MKTLFTPIVKVKKFEVDKIQIRLQQIESVIEQTQQTLKQIQYQILSITLPQEGNFGQILAQQMIKNAYLQELSEHQSHLHHLLHKKQECLEEKKKADLDYEKMKHLHDKESSRLVALLKAKEAKELDEIGLTLFNAKGA